MPDAVNRRISPLELTESLIALGNTIQVAQYQAGQAARLFSYFRDVLPGFSTELESVERSLSNTQIQLNHIRTGYRQSVVRAKLV